MMFQTLIQTAVIITAMTTASFAAKLTVPSAPAGLTASIATSDPFVTVSWTPVSGALSYSIERHTGTTGTFAVIGTTENPPYLDTAITAGTIYNYRVVASNADGASVPSQGDTAETWLYCILNPRGGQSYNVGDTVTIRMSAAEGKTAGLEISVDGWLMPISLPAIGFSGTFNPMATNTVRFVIPPYYLMPTSPTTADTILTPSTTVQVRIFNYSQSSDILAVSQGYFTIRSATAVQPRSRNHVKGAGATPRTGTIINSSNGHISPEITTESGTSRYTLIGKSIPQ